MVAIYLHFFYQIKWSVVWVGVGWAFGSVGLPHWVFITMPYWVLPGYIFPC